MPSAVGRRVPRQEGPQKLCGLAKYIDDYELPGCLYGATLRSGIPAGRIRRVRFDRRFPWKECVIATARDIPGRNVVALIEDDQPLLADKVVRHAMEPILLVAHPRRQTAYEALKHIQVDYEPLPPVLTLEESLRARRVIYGEDNVFKRFEIRKGDVRAAIARADVVVEGTYRVPHQEHAYIENNGMAAWFEPDGTLVVLGSMQCPYYVVKALKPLFALPEERLRVIQAVTGGGFGGKEEYPNMVAGHAALLALKARRPVKLVYDRHEDMAATTKRHPAVVRHRTGLTRDGRLLAQEIDIVMDGGAYVTLSPVVLSRGILHATGPYECPNVLAVARTVATNTPPNGAFRGFGAPQTLFAAELHWEKIGRALGKDPLDLRRKNLVRVGSELATGQVLKESVGASAALETAVRMSGFERKRREHDRFNRRRGEPVWRGVGLAVVQHGAGFTGNGEVYLASKAAVALTREGRVRVDAASTEIGQGTNTLFAQIAADTLGVPYELVEVQTPDTRRVPDSGPTVASRTCMVVGGLVREAAQALKTAVAGEGGRFPSEPGALREAARRLMGRAPERRFEAQYRRPEGMSFDDRSYRGDAYATYSYMACVVELEVDKATFEVRPLKLWAAVDIGRAIHPKLAEGQVIGGAAQALGWALWENPVYKGGVMQNAQLTNYIIPTSADTPPMEVAFVDQAFSGGPFGAKGVGELPMDVPGPAVAAAIHQATGLLVPELPVLPERLQRAFHEAHGK